MFQLRQGKKSMKFGRVELLTSVSKASLLTSFAIAMLTWVAVELLPNIDAESGWVSVAAGLAAQIIPMVIMLLRNNKDITIEDKKIDPPKKG
jgi:hypothetical protein